jgi:hypothetical protein
VQNPFRYNNEFRISDDDNQVLTSSDSALTEDNVTDLQTLHNEVISKKCLAYNLSSAESFVKLGRLLEELKVRLASTSITAKLWIQYNRYVDILKLFTTAERTGNWAFHLSSVAQMLFAATGHTNYAKSSRLYLEMKLQLPSECPWLYENFMKDGFHVFRTSNRFWTGISTDLAIETHMMKEVKSKNGLTNGRGLSENVRTTWVKTAHMCAAIHTSMLAVTDLLNKVLQRDTAC